MYDDLHTPEDHTDKEQDFQAPRSKPSDNDGARTRRTPDREVPIPNSGGPALLNQWLDGDVSVAVLRATPGGNDAVDLWNKIHDEAETLRSRTTPLYVHKRIMDSLPDDKYRGQLPWYKRSINMNPAALIAAAVVLLGIGAIIAHAVLK